MHSIIYDLLWSLRCCIMIGICIYIATLYGSWWLRYAFTYVPNVDIEFTQVCTLTHCKRYIRTYRMRVHIFNGLIWLNLIRLTVRKMEIDIPERDIQSKSPSDCSIDLCSILWFYCRLWFIVSDDEIIDFERINIFHWKAVIFTAVIFLQSYLLHRFTVNW